MMDHDQLAFDLANAVSVKLLRTPHAPLLLSFLYREFKQSGRVTIAHSTLAETLDEYLETLRLDHPDRYPGAAALYLRQWCDEEHRFLRRYHEANSDDPVYELTADTERALGWVQELHRSEFVGTESRFLRIFDLLREIVEMSTVNAADRLAQLEAQKAAIQAQIDAIQATGQVQRSSSTQLKERFFDANDLARRLIADFREVEENFRAIARDVQKQQLQAGVSKGQIVGYVLDADIALKESDQGRSFYAFWQFLLSHSKQEELRVLLDKVYMLPDLPTAREEQQIVRQLKRRLIDAGSKIVDSNRRLAEQLRKLLDEQRLAEARRVQELIAEIKQAAIRLEQAWPEGADFTEIDGLPAVNLPMERQFWRPTVKTTFGDTEIAIAEFERELLRIRQDDLPRYRERFKSLLNEKVIENIALLHGDLHRYQEEIEENIATLNTSLRTINYTSDTYIQLHTEASRDVEICAFKQELQACLPDVGRRFTVSLSIRQQEEDYEASFRRIQALITKFKEEARWTDKVTDVRQWLDFAATERYRADDSIKEYYSDSAGKSGGQKAKLAYTILASAIAYQYGLKAGEAQSGAFRFVVVDEAFSRSDQENSRYAMALFQELELQLLVVTPMTGIHIVEPYIAACHFVFNNSEGNDSQVETMTIQQLRAQRQVLQNGTGNDHDHATGNHAESAAALLALPAQ